MSQGMTAAITSKLSASSIYALANSTQNAGDQHCHYCGSACDRSWMHDDHVPLTIERAKFKSWATTRRCPGNPWICIGCRLWRRPSITIDYLTDTSLPFIERTKDRQSPMHNSWWITPTAAIALRTADRHRLYPLLLSPPKQFVLTMLTDAKIENRLQQCQANDNEEIKADTPLSFTLDNVAHTYTVYELEEALKNKTVTGKSAGVRELMRWCGPWEMPAAKEAKGEPKMGRPSEPLGNGSVTKRKIR